MWYGLRREKRATYDTSVVCISNFMSLPVYIVPRHSACPATDCKDMLPQPRRRPHCYSSAWALRDNGPDSESTQVRHSITIHSWEARRRPRAHFAELLVGLLVAADGRQPNDRALPLCDTSGVGVIVASGSAAVYAWISKFAPSPTLRFPQARIVQ